MYRTKDIPVLVIDTDDYTLEVLDIVLDTFGTKVAHDCLDELSLGDLVKVGSAMLADKLRQEGKSNGRV